MQGYNILHCHLPVFLFGMYDRLAGVGRLSPPLDHSNRQKKTFDTNWIHAFFQEMISFWSKFFIVFM